MTPPGAKPDTDTLQGLLSAGSSDVDSDSDIPQVLYRYITVQVTLDKHCTVMSNKFIIFIEKIQS